jgi:hypothetical protein
VLGEAGVPTIRQQKYVEIEVTPRTHIVYKCEVKDLVSPLAFNIEFPSEIEFKNANLEIFLSANSRTPNKENHELMIIKQKKFKVKL